VDRGERGGQAVKEFIEFVQGVGFPVAVAAVLLWDRLTITNKLLSVLSRIEARLPEKGSDVMRRV
jgi:hypothetical protein